MSSCGKVYVGKKAGKVKGSSDPKIDGVKNISVVSSSMNKVDGNCMKEMSPMRLGPVIENKIKSVDFVTNLRAENFENYWQYGKIFQELNHVKTKKGRKVITKNFVKFRQLGYDKTIADRHPRGTKTNEVLFVDAQGRNRYRYLTACTSYYNDEFMDYLTSRKIIYVRIYAELVKRTEAFKSLRRLVRNGTDVQILDFDIIPGSHLITEKFIRKRLNDPKKPFGHGYIVASLLSKIDIISMTYE